MQRGVQEGEDNHSVPPGYLSDLWANWRLMLLLLLRCHQLLRTTALLRDEQGRRKPSVVSGPQRLIGYSHSTNELLKQKRDNALFGAVHSGYNVKTSLQQHTPMQDDKNRTSGGGGAHPSLSGSTGAGLKGRTASSSMSGSIRMSAGLTTSTIHSITNSNLHVRNEPSVSFWITRCWPLPRLVLTHSSSHAGYFPKAVTMRLAQQKVAIPKGESY